MFRKYFVNTSILIVVLFAGANIAKACLCSSENISFKDEVESTSAVFIGKPITNGKKKWKIEVSKVYKGEVEEVIYLDDALAGSSCASRFNQGQEYLFFVGASKDGSNDIPNRRKKLQVFYAGPCSMTTAMSVLEKYSPQSKEKVWKILGDGKTPIKKKKL